MNQGFTPKQKQELVQLVDLTLKPIKKDLGKLKKDMKTVINLFDREIIGLDKRVLRVEKHLNLSTA